MKPTPEQLQKLPKWAQEHIADLERERFVSVRALNEFCDESTPSPFSVSEHVCDGETRGPSVKKRYVQAHTIDVEYKGVMLSVAAHDFGNSGEGIKISWGTKGLLGDAAFIPCSYQQARIVSKEHMR